MKFLTLPVLHTYKSATFTYGNQPNIDAFETMPVCFVVVDAIHLRKYKTKCSSPGKHLYFNNH
ncbi:MAG: hypothetical protein AAFO91_09735 [Bacteroidota bacterium]